MISFENNVLPDGWRLMKLKDKEVCELIMGQSPSSDTYNNDSKGMPFFQGKKEFGELYPSVEKYCTAPKKIAYPGDILLSVRAPVGPTNIANIECCIGRGLAAIRPNLKYTLKNYLLYYFRNFELEISKKGRGSTFGAITKNALEESIIPIPPIPEQKRIVAKIDSLFAKIDKAITLTEESLKQAENLLPSVLKQVFDKGKEEDWEKKKLEEICTIINGRAYKKKELLSEGKYKVLRVGNLFTNNSWYWSDLELKEDKYISNGDLIYAWSASFGPRIWDGEKVIYHYHIWKIVNGNEVSKRFLYNWLDWKTATIKKENTSGTTMIHVTKGMMESLVIHYPDIQIQKQIVKSIEKVRNNCVQTQSKLEEQLKYLKNLKSSILAKAFSGDL